MPAAKKRITVPENYLDLVFRPADGLVYQKNGEGLVVLDMENKGFFNTVAQRFFHKPRVSHIALDRYGSTLWSCLDGERSVFEVTEEMKRAFPGEEERMLDRCLHFFRTLEGHHFITR